MQIIIALVAFLIAISFLVLVHEFGHFLMARCFGVKVLKFSLGFGKPLFVWHSKKSGTDYMVCSIPIGGYVKMLGEHEKVANADELKYSYEQQSVLKRMAIVFAGPLFNVLFAVLVLWLTYMIGLKTLIPVIGKVHLYSPAYSVGLRKDQQIMQVDGVKTIGWGQVENRLIRRLGEQGNIILQTKNIHTHKTLTHRLPIKAWHKSDFRELDLLDVIGIEPRLPIIPPVIARVTSRGRAKQSGIKPNDKVLAINNKKIYTFNELSRAVELNPEKQIRLLIARNDHKLHLLVTPELKQLSGAHSVGRIGIYSKKIDWPKDWLIIEQYGPLKAFIPTLQQTGFMATISVDLLWKMMTGKLSLRYVGGPITIARGAGKTIRYGIIYFLRFLALISIGLAIINLLPIPVLDGGYLLYYLFELVMRRPLPEKIQVIGIRLGLIFLLGLMTLAFFNDILQLWM